MGLSIGKEIAALGRMTAKELRTKYQAVFGEETRSYNKAWLVKRIAWRIQADVEGDLSERARRRAVEIANDSDLRLRPPKAETAPTNGTTTRATPIPPGTATSAIATTSVRTPRSADGIVARRHQFLHRRSSSSSSSRSRPSARTTNSWPTLLRRRDGSLKRPPRSSRQRSGGWTVN